MGAGSTGNSERAEMQSVPNHGVASGAGSTASTLGPRQEGENSCTLLAKSPFPSPSDISVELLALLEPNTSSNFFFSSLNIVSFVTSKLWSTL